MFRLDRISLRIAWRWMALALALAAAPHFQKARGDTSHGWKQAHWDRPHGLPEHEVTALLQTRDGAIWIGLRTGLARFDGLAFTSYNRANTAALETPWVTALAEDGEGRLIVGTKGRSHGGDLVIRHSDHWERVSVGQMVVLRTDGAGRVWAGSDAGVHVVVGGRVCRPAGEFSKNAVTALDIVGKEAWIGGRGGLGRFDPKLRDFLEAPAPVPGFGETKSALSAADPDGLWALTTLAYRESRLSHFRGGVWRPFSHPAVIPGGLSRPAFLGRDHAGGLWVPQENGTILRVCGAEAELINVPWRISEDYPTCWLEDREKSVWIGSERSGLYRLQRTPFQTVADAPDNAWAVTPAPGGGVWAGADDGLSHVVLEGGKPRVKNYLVEDYPGLAEIRALATEPSGKLWIGTGQSLFTLDQGRLEPVHFPVITHLADPQGLASRKVRALCRTSDGSMWIATPDVLRRFRGESMVAWDTALPSVGRDIRAILEDRAGNLWMGTAGGGLLFFAAGSHPQESGEELRPGRIWRRADGLPDDFVWALHEDAQGRLWCGTEKGLGLFDGARFSAFNVDHGLPTSSINSVMTDDQGWLWIGHDDGIYRVEIADLLRAGADRKRPARPVLYDEHDGLTRAETNGQKSQPPVCKTPDGRIWFPTIGGLAVVDPRAAKSLEVDPGAVIEQVIADGKPSLSAIEHAAPPAVFQGPLRFAPDAAQVLEFKYAAHVFNAPERLQFRYRMRGVDDRWQEADSGRTAYFPNLPPGEYRFEVMARNHHGAWSRRPAGISLEIAPHYWETWWFWPLVILTASLCAWALLRWRILELQRIEGMRRENALLMERQRIARNLHDGLGADLTRLAWLADLAAQAGGSDGGIKEAVNNTFQTLKESIWLTHPGDSTIGGLVEYMQLQAHRILSQARTKCAFRSVGKIEGTTLSSATRQAAYLASKEIFHNVARHAKATQVEVEVRTEAGWLMIAISDNGCGFSGDKTKPPAATAPGPGGGSGLHNIQQRARDLGGTCAFESAPGVGVKISLRLPLQHR